MSFSNAHKTQPPLEFLFKIVLEKILEIINKKTIDNMELPTYNLS